MIKIKALRKKQNLSQKDIAEHLNVAISTISAWENGVYDIDTQNLVKLANFFDVTVDELLGIKTQGLFDNAKVERPEILEIYKDLTPAQQNNLLNYARGMAVSNALEAESRESRRKKA